MPAEVTLDIDGAVATITNRNPERHNAFDDAMDARLFEILTELQQRPDVRAVVWRGEGPSFSSGRDTSKIGTFPEGVSHHDLVRRAHRGIQQLWELDAPVLVAAKGWVIGVSFERALLCDIRIAAEDARFRLPELSHGVIPDSGGMGVLFQMAGHGVVSDMVLTGRTMSASEALSHGIISRVVPERRLDDTILEMAERITRAPKATVKMGRRVLHRLAAPEQRSSMGDEMMYQSFIYKSADYAEFKTARRDGRSPRYTGS